MAAGDVSYDSGLFKVTAPTGGYTKGLIYQLNSGEYVVALETVAAAALCFVNSFIPGKRFEVTKPAATGEGASQGGRVYVNSSAQADANATGNTLVPNVVWAEDAGATDATGFIRYGSAADQ